MFISTLVGVTLIGTLITLSHEYGAREEREEVARGEETR